MRRSVQKEPSYRIKGKILCIAVLVIFLASAPASISGHAPSEMELTYDSDSQTLHVTIVHGVSDPATHYVYRIHIVKNGADFLTQEYESQPTDSQFSHTFQVPAAPGDVLEVTAECNLGGSIAETLEIGKSATARVKVPEVWPFHAGLMSVGLFLMLVAVGNVVGKTPKGSWLKAHKVVGGLSIALVVCGLIVGGYMVSLAGGGHLRVPHAYVGAVTLLFSVVTPILGFTALKWKAHRRPVRTMHVWVSRTTIALIIVTIVSGLMQAGIL